MPECFKCGLALASVDSLLAHFKVKHFNEVFDVYQCKESGCFTNCKSWSQLRRHFRSFHQAPSKPGNLKSSVQSNLHEDTNDCDVEDFSPSNNDCGISDDNFIPKNLARDFQDDLHGFILNYIGKLYADPSLPRSHVQVMVDGTKVLLNRIFSVVTPTVLSTLQSQDIEQNVVDRVKGVLDVTNSCFDEFSTEYRRLKILSNTGCLLYPQPYVIGHAMEDRKKDNMIVKQIVQMTGQIIPLRKLFKKFFSLPGVYDICKNYMENLEKETDVLSNFVQGKLWKDKKEKYFKDKVVFPLFVYFDDLEVNNPLGSHKGLSKLGATYVTIPCLPPEFRSTLDNIFLAVLFHSMDRSKYGNVAVFSNLVEEINYLQRTGVTLNISGHSVQVYFALGLILGDNLGLNGILGYVESFRANYFCRFCKTHRDITHSDCVERRETLRKVEEYEDDVWADVEDSGVKEDSIWNNVDYFHVYHNYCSDPLLHEMAEGAGKRAMRRMVHHYIFVSKTFSLERLNQRLKTFKYSACGISNKPPMISDTELQKKKIHMSGSEMINFITIFGVLIGDLVPVDDEVWKLYLVLRQILEIVSAKSVQPQCINLLKYLVSVYHSLYIKLFNENLKAKEHIMVHWPLIMSMSGPLSLISTMRMEAKNRLFKIRSNATSSRTDIVYTTALKEQLQFCFRLASNTGLVPKFEIGPATHVRDMEDVCYTFKEFSTGVTPDTLKTCVEVPWVNVKGTTYKVGMCLALSYDECDLPEFGEIHKIFCCEQQNVYFLCRYLLTNAFDEHFHAFKVDKTDSFVCVKHDDLLAYLPVIHAQNPNGNHYICMK